VPPRTLSNAAGLHELASIVHKGLPDDLRNHLAYFAIRVGARRANDAAGVLNVLGLEEAANVAARQARLIGGLQYDVVTDRSSQAPTALAELAQTYGELVDALDRKR
jgi:hypothetical protein